jgi:hypothetical protein
VSQATLFDVPKPDSPGLDGQIDLEKLEGYAFLYTATDKGNSTGVRFMMTVSDAQKWCETKVSSGVLHGSRWAYFWTSVTNYLKHRQGWIPEHGGRPSLQLKFDRSQDSGLWDGRIAAAGCVKIGLEDAAALLEKCGVEVTVL